MKATKTENKPKYNGSDHDIVTLQSHDGKEFKVTCKAAIRSETIRNLIEDAGIDYPIPLPNINGQNLSEIVELLNGRVDNDIPIYAKPSENNPDEKTLDNNLEATEKEKKYWSSLGANKEHLYEIINATNYLDIPDLFHLACLCCANKIKGKTIEEVCKEFNLKDDITKDEYDLILKENPWLNE